MSALHGCAHRACVHTAPMGAAINMSLPLFVCLHRGAIRKPKVSLCLSLLLLRATPGPRRAAPGLCPQHRPLFKLKETMLQLEELPLHPLPPRLLLLLFPSVPPVRFGSLHEEAETPTSLVEGTPAEEELIPHLDSSRLSLCPCAWTLGCMPTCVDQLRFSISKVLPMEAAFNRTVKSWHPCCFTARVYRHGITQRVPAQRYEVGHP